MANGLIGIIHVHLLKKFSGLNYITGVLTIPEWLIKLRLKNMQPCVWATM